MFLLRRDENWATLSRRQRKRRREATYWDKVLLHTLAQVERVRRTRFVLSYKRDYAVLEEALQYVDSERYDAPKLTCVLACVPSA